MKVHTSGRARLQPSLAQRPAVGLRPGGLRGPAGLNSAFRIGPAATSLKCSGSSPAERKQLSNFIKGHFAERAKSKVFWTNVLFAAVWNFVTFDTVYNWTFIGDIVAAGIGTNEAMVWIARAWVWLGGAYLMFITAKALFWDLPSSIFKRTKPYNQKEITSFPIPVDHVGGLSHTIIDRLAALGIEVPREAPETITKKTVKDALNELLIPQLRGVADSRAGQTVIHHMISREGKGSKVVMITSSFTPQQVLDLAKKHPNQPFFPVVEDADPGSLRGVVYPERLTTAAVAKAEKEIEEYNASPKAKSKPERLLSRLMVPKAELSLIVGVMDEVTEVDRALVAANEDGRCVMDLQSRFIGIYLLPASHPIAQLRRMMRQMQESLTGSVRDLEAKIEEKLAAVPNQKPEAKPKNDASVPPSEGKIEGKKGKPEKSAKPEDTPAAPITGDKPVEGQASAEVPPQATTPPAAEPKPAAPEAESSPPKPSAADDVTPPVA